MNELIELLKKLGLSEEDAINEVADMAKGMVEAETEKGKEFYRKKDTETKGLRESLKKLGYDSDKFENVDDYLSAIEKDKNQSATTLDSLKEALETIKGELAGEKELRVSEHNKSVLSSVRADLTSALAGKVYGEKHVISGIMAENESSFEDGKTKIGGVLLSDFVTAFQKENPDILRTTQLGGAGEPPAGSDVDLNEMDTLSFMGAK